MPDQPSWPDGREPTDADLTGAATLAKSALLSPDPSPQAERESRERALAQFQESAPFARGLHDDGKQSAWTGRVRRVLRRILRK